MNKDYNRLSDKELEEVVGGASRPVQLSESCIAYFPEFPKLPEIPELPELSQRKEVVVVNTITYETKTFRCYEDFLAWQNTTEYLDFTRQ